MTIARTITTLVFIILIDLPKTFSCECVDMGPFLTVAPKTELIALVKVKKYLTYNDLRPKSIPGSMEVEIIDIYKGVETRKTVTVWGDNGMLCRPYLTEFAVGNYYVIAFDKLGKEDDYYISICGSYWLNADINKQIATGKITNSQTQVNLLDLKLKIAATNH